jgi:hypothetical protein
MTYAPQFPNQLATFRDEVASGVLWRVTGNPKTLSIRNRKPAAAQVSTITVGSVSEGTSYYFTLNGVSFTIVASSGTAATVAGQIKSAVQAHPIAGRGLAVTIASNVVTFTSLNTNESFSISGTSPFVAATGTAAAAAAALGWGVGVIRSGTVSSDQMVDAVLADESYLAAQVDAILFANYANSKHVTVTLSMPGYPNIGFSHTTASDLATSGAAIASGLQAQVDATWGTNAVTVAFNTATLTITAGQAGKAFRSSVTANTLTWTLTSSADTNPQTDAREVFLGVTMKRPDSASTSLAAADGIGAGQDGEAVYEGAIIVPVSSAPTEWSSQVWMGLDGSEKGLFYSTASISRVYLGDRARWAKSSAALRSGQTGYAALLFKLNN